MTYIHAHVTVKLYKGYTLTSSLQVLFCNLVVYIVSLAVDLTIIATEFVPFAIEFTFLPVQLNIEVVTFAIELGALSLKNLPGAKIAAGVNTKATRSNCFIQVLTDGFCSLCNHNKTQKNL